MSMHEHASPRPSRRARWKVHEGDDYIVIMRGTKDKTTDTGIFVDNRKDADRIVAAVNEHNARVAVCDAAKKVISAIGNITFTNALGDLEEALIALDELMKGKQTCE